MTKYFTCGALTTDNKPDLVIEKILFEPGIYTKPNDNFTNLKVYIKNIGEKYGSFFLYFSY